MVPRPIVVSSLFSTQSLSWPWVRQNVFSIYHFSKIINYIETNRPLKLRWNFVQNMVRIVGCATRISSAIVWVFFILGGYFNKIGLGGTHTCQKTTESLVQGLPCYRGTKPLSGQYWFLIGSTGIIRIYLSKLMEPSRIIFIHTCIRIHRPQTTLPNTHVMLTGEYRVVWGYGTLCKDYFLTMGTRSKHICSELESREKVRC